MTSVKARKKGGETSSSGVGAGVTAVTGGGGEKGREGTWQYAKSLLDAEREWERDELLDVLHWIRQTVGVTCGVIWGLVPLVGGLWFLVFTVLSVAIAFVYYSVILKVDEEEFGGHAALIQEGMMPSVGLFLLTWILVYSLLYF